MRQFITCSAESYILIWDLKRPPADIIPKATVLHQDDDDDVFEEESDKEEEKPKKETEERKKMGWAGLKAKTSAIATSSVFSSKKWTPAVGKYDKLN